MHSTPSQSVDKSQSACGTQDECSSGIDTMHSTLSLSVCDTQHECSNGIDTLHSTECPNGIDTLHVPQRPLTAADFCDPDFLRRCAAAQSDLRSLSELLQVHMG